MVSTNCCKKSEVFCRFVDNITPFKFLANISMIVFLQGLQEMAQQGTHLQPNSPLPRNPSTLTLPPAYDLLMGASGDVGPSEPPPPSYEEAMFLIGEDKSRPFLESRHNPK